MAKTDVVEPPKLPDQNPEPVLKARAFQWQGGRGVDFGNCWKVARVEMPPEIKTAQAAREFPGMWKNIQANHTTALEREDVVRCVAHDGSWIQHFMVQSANMDRVTLARIGGPISMPPMDAEWSDEHHFIKWHEGSYWIFRKLDGVGLEGGFRSVTQAQMRLATIDGRRVA